MGQLNELQIKAAQPREKEYMLSDGEGCLHRIKERGNLETAQRVREAVQHAFQYAVDVGAQPLRLTQSFRLVTTTVEDATRWGATHWSMPPREPGEPALVVLFRAERGECVECDSIQRVFQPINQEGGGDPICGDCLLNLDWMTPVILGDLPTHVTQA
jgi:hypothetical protein